MRGSTVIPLGGDPVWNPGHELFHTAAAETQTGPDAGSIGFIACASCHPEGGDDAQSWPSAGGRLRRTQSLEGGISGTEPFHWDGGMHSMRALSEAVFVGRMGGRELTSEELVSMLHWIDSIPRPKHAAIQDPEAVARGRELFADPSLGCLTCHNGPRFGSNLSVDVGTGLVAQVPSLVGVAYRLPVMHTGCATSLVDRFDPDCGGRAHGAAYPLYPFEKEALAAYLSSL